MLASALPQLKRSSSDKTGQGVGGGDRAALGRAGWRGI